MPFGVAEEDARFRLERANEKKIIELEAENSRLRKYIQGQHEATLQTIDAYQKQIEVLTCKKQ
jgi:hypothetical protein